MLSSLCGLPASGKTTLAKQLERQHRARRLSPERAIVPGAPEDETWERLVREGHAQRIAAALALIPALLSWVPGDALGRVAVPRAVISGGLDTFTGGANAERVAAALRCELVVMPRVGHGPMLEAPERSPSYCCRGSGRRPWTSSRALLDRGRPEKWSMRDGHAAHHAPWGAGPRGSAPGLRPIQEVARESRVRSVALFGKACHSGPPEPLAGRRARPGPA